MIRLSNICVDGFRLLEGVSIAVEAGTTVIVGRNNSGKTSLMEVFDKFLGERVGQFRLEDFSASFRAKFLSAKALRDAGDATADDVLAALPVISLDLTFAYDALAGDLGPLSPFIIDLDPDCTTAIARLEYSPTLATLASLLDLPAADADENPNAALFRHLRDAIPKSYSVKTLAIDPTDATNRRAFDNTSAISALLQVGFVKAQRALDLGKRGDPDVIGKLLNKLFKTASSRGAAQDDQVIVADLMTSVGQIENSMQGNFDTKLKELLPALNLFGFPSLNDTELVPQTSIDVESLLTDNTRILYTGADGVHLPEGYNGLGTRNLIYMLLQLEALHKGYRATPTRPAAHIVFIEEPEAHLHPQMQEVFIAQLNEAISALSRRYPAEPAWQVQFIVSTHSSHIANAASFEAIRYFLNTPTDVPGIRRTKVKDFRRGMAGIAPEDRKFLHQYMTLTKCDLYFADKAILVEGATERILMPRIIKIVDEGLNDGLKLGRQYVTTMEVGGAHAQIFFPLLEYLELKTLIITDLDAVRVRDGRRRKCPCAEGEFTSNNALKSWFDDNDISVASLTAKTAAEKIRNFCRIAYQTPEAGSNHCARSYEDAFILANLNHFQIPDDEHAATTAWEMAQSFGKSEEAIRFAIMEEEWNVPRYIREGLIWLSEPPPAPEPPPILPAHPEEAVA